MSFKTIVIIVLTILVTVVLMNNTDEIDFWIFGDASVPKLAMMGAMFACGLIIGYLLGKPKKGPTNIDQSPDHERSGDHLSPEDREFIQ